MYISTVDSHYSRHFIDLTIIYILNRYNCSIYSYWYQLWDILLVYILTIFYWKKHNSFKSTVDNKFKRLNCTLCSEYSCRYLRRKRRKKHISSLTGEKQEDEKMQHQKSNKTFKTSLRSSPLKMSDIRNCQVRRKSKFVLYLEKFHFFKK